MRIQHNISSLNTYESLKKSTSLIGKNLEKLASGYRINRAGDDAAGLAISEKMRAQITGLEQAGDNALDGISLIQTAEGAMEEIHSMLNRMMELSVQSSNGTYSDENRSSMQDEINAILDEIQRIEKNTNFNDIPLLQGNDAKLPPVATIKGGMPVWVDMPQKDSNGLTGSYITTETYTDASGAQQQYQVEHAAAYMDFSQLNAGNINDLLNENTGIYTTCCTCEAHYSIKFTTGTSSKSETSGQHYIYSIGIDGVSTGAELINRIIQATKGNPNNHYTMLAADAANPSQLVIYDDRAYPGKIPSVPAGGKWDNWKNPYTASPSVSQGRGLFGEGVAYKYEPKLVGDVVLHVTETSNEDGQLSLLLPEMGLSQIGISNLSISTAENAKSSIGRIQHGIDYVSQERGRMGAYQNRVEHTVNNLSVMKENITASESRIRDVDMAKEMGEYTKNNILIQSAQAMLSQANQVPNAVLQLLQ